MIGPVPAGSHAPKLVLLTSSAPPAWSASAVYHQGEKVSFAGLPYEARWYTHGEQPREELPSSPSAPWEPLFKYPGEPSDSGSEGERRMIDLRRRDKQASPGIRRQWGADSHEDPMPVVPRIAGEWAMMFGRAAVVLTVGAWVALVVTVLNGQVIEGVSGHASLLETIGFLVAVSVLAASATAYLFGRLGFYYRARQHRRMPRAMIDEFFADRQPTLTALVPSYQEEPGVILMTLLSTALQEYPDLRVVLLIDDPPNPRYAGPRRLLDSALALPAEVERLLSEPRHRFDLKLERFESTVDPDEETGYDDLVALAGEYEYAAAWIQSLAKQYKVSDHNERFFTNHVLGQLAADLALTGQALRAAAEDDPGKLPLCAPGAALPATRLDVPGGDLVLPAQALHLALGRAEQGDEPQQLHRADGRQLPGGADPGRAEPRAGRRGDPRPGRAGMRLRADDRRRQRDHAGVLPAAGPPARARGEQRHRRRPVALQRLPRRGDAHRADRRCDHRPAAHHPPGDDLPRRRPSGSARTRSCASARSTTSRRSTTRASSRSAATSPTAP